MTHIRVFVAALALVAGLGPKSAIGAPRIEPTFPPPDETRQADRVHRRVHPGAVSVLAYSPDGRMVATGGRDGVVRVFVARTGENDTGAELARLTGHRGSVRSLVFSVDNLRVVSAGAEGTVRVFDVQKAAEIERGAFPRNFADVQLVPGQLPRLVGRRGAGLDLWDWKSGKLVRRFETPEGMPRPFALPVDGERLGAVLQPGKFTIWQTEVGHRTYFLDISGRTTALALGPTHAVAGHRDGSLAVWGLAQAGPPSILRGSRASVQTVAVDKRGSQVAAAGKRGVVDIWDVASGTRLCRLVGHRGPVLAVAFNSNGQKMASTGADGTLRTWTVPLPPIPADRLTRIEGALPAAAVAPPKKPRRLLVFWRADAILHKDGVPAANHAIELIGRKTGAFEADFSRDTAVFDPRVLARYDALVLNSTAHLVISENRQKQALLDYVQGGGGIVGIHAAIDMFKTWPEGAEIVGATFAAHPWTPSGTWRVRLEEPAHPLLRAFGGKGFSIKDEFYELGEPYRRDDRRVLLSLDLADAATAAVRPHHRTDKDFAVSWVKRTGKGRVFYAMFGHRGEPFENPAVLRFTLDGIQYALGDLEVDDSPRTARSAPGR